MQSAHNLVGCICCCRNGPQNNSTNAIICTIVVFSIRLKISQGKAQFHVGKLTSMSLDSNTRWMPKKHIEQALSRFQRVIKKKLTGHLGGSAG